MSFLASVGSDGAVRRPVRHGLGHHEQLPADRAVARTPSLAVVAPGIAEALFATASAWSPRSRRCSPTTSSPATSAATPTRLESLRRRVRRHPLAAARGAGADGRGHRVHAAAGAARHAGARRCTPMSEINVTPLVDVMLVLLIIFMVTAPLLTVGVPVDLPKTEALADRRPGRAAERHRSTPRARSSCRRPRSTLDSSAPRLQAITEKQARPARSSCAATRRSTTARSWRSWAPSSTAGFRRWRWCRAGAAVGGRRHGRGRACGRAGDSRMTAAAPASDARGERRWSDASAAPSGVDARRRPSCRRCRACRRAGCWRSSSCRLLRAAAADRARAGDGRLEAVDQQAPRPRSAIQPPAQRAERRGDRQGAAAEDRAEPPPAAAGAAQAPTPPRPSRSRRAAGAEKPEAASRPSRRRSERAEARRSPSRRRSRSRRAAKPAAARR